MSRIQSATLSPRCAADLVVRPLRLLIVNSLREWGGGEKWVVATAQGLAERGHSVVVASPPGSALEQRVRDAARATEGISPHPVSMRNDLAAPAIWELFRLCRRFRPDAVILCTQRAARLGAPAARLAGVPTVVMRNGLEGAFSDKAWNRWLARHAISHFVCNAYALRSEILSFDWLPPERIRVLYNGVDVERLRPRLDRGSLRASLSIPATAPVLLCAARLAHGKGQDDLIRAVAVLSQTFPDVVLLLAGDGAFRERLETLATEVGVAERVRFLGFRQDIPDLASAADVVVVASHREGLPNIVLEAMALGRPVVATAVSGTPEAVIDGETGLLVPAGAPAELAAALRRLLADPEYARALGARAQRRVLAEFDARVALERWERFLTESSPPSPPIMGGAGRVESNAPPIIGGLGGLSFSADKVSDYFRFLVPLAAYNVLQAALAPLLLGRFLRRVFLLRKDYVGWRQRLGLRPVLASEELARWRDGSPRLWLFCRSIGEYRAALPLLRRTLESYPEATVLLFATTAEVAPAVREAFQGDRVWPAYLPYDCIFPALAHLNAARPDAVLFVESFWYPNLLPLARAHGADVAVLNFGVKPITFRHTRRFTFRHWLRQTVNRIGVQDRADIAPLAELGVARDRIDVTGNLKFDAPPPSLGPADLKARRHELGIARPLVVAGSTHDGEEAILLDAFATVNATVPCQLVLAPRYVRRAAELVELCGQRGLRCALRSSRSTPSEPWDVLILDTMGELAAIYALASVAFVGGSLAPVGGHNVIEPIAAGVPTFFGPHMAAFRAIAAEAVAAGVAWESADAASLAAAWRELLSDEERRREVSERARELMRANRGATERSLALLDRLLTEGRDG